MMGILIPWPGERGITYIYLPATANLFPSCFMYPSFEQSSTGKHRTA